MRHGRALHARRGAVDRVGAFVMDEVSCVHCGWRGGEDELEDVDDVELCPECHEPIDGGEDE